MHDNIPKEISSIFFKSSNTKLTTRFPQQNRNVIEIEGLMKKHSPNLLQEEKSSMRTFQMILGLLTKPLFSILKSNNNKGKGQIFVLREKSGTRYWKVFIFRETHDGKTDKTYPFLDFLRCFSNFFSFLVNGVRVKSSSSWRARTSIFALYLLSSLLSAPTKSRICKIVTGRCHATNNVKWHIKLADI